MSPIARIVLPLAVLAPLCAPLAGCGGLLAMHNPMSNVPATGTEATTEAAASDPPDAQPRAKAKSSAAVDPMQERQLTLGDNPFSVTLPCAPVADKADKDDSPLGSVVDQGYACDDDASGLSFVLLAVKFTKPLKAGVDATSKTTAAAKWLGHQMCDANESKKCDVPGTLIVSSAIADFKMSFPGKVPSTVAVAARYPLAVALTVVGDPTTDAAMRVLRSIKIPAQP